MKKKTIFKIVLMFIILASVLVIHNRVNATTIEPDANGVYRIYFRDVRDSMEIFCIQKNNWLPSNGPDGGPLKYKAFGEAIELNKNSDIMAERAWAFLLAVAQKNADSYDTTEWQSLADNPIQKKIWDAIGNNNNNFINQIQSKNLDVSSWQNSSESLLKEAYEFAYNNKNLQIESIEINTDDTTYLGKDIGPFTIVDGEGKKCDYAIVDGEIIAGITKFNVNLSSDPNLKILLYYMNNNKKEYLNSYDEEKKEYLYNSIDYVKLNQNMSQNLYLELKDDPVISSISFDLEYQTINPVATIQLLKSDMPDKIIESTRTVWCDRHSDDSETIPYSGIIYIWNYSTGINEPGINDGYKYTSDPVGTYFLGNDGNIHYYTKSDKKPVEYKKCVFCGLDGGGSKTKDELNNKYGKQICSASPSGNKPHSFTVTIGHGYRFKATEVAVYKTCSNTAREYYYDTKNGTHGYSDVKCGTTIISKVNYHFIQDLALIKSGLSEKTIETSETIDITPMYRELTLLKTNILNGKLVKNAEFSVSISNIKSFYYDDVKHTLNSNEFTFDNLKLASGKFTIEKVELADKDAPVVIKLRETKVPAGYVGIDGEVTITLNYLDKTENVTYDSQVTEENIVVDETKLKQNVVEIKAKNDPKPEARIKLTKVDNDNNYAPIQGVKFNGIIENAIKPFTAEKMQEFSLTTDKDGILITDEFMIDDITKNVVITLTEVEIPEQEGFRYKELDGSIEIILKYIENDDGIGSLVLDKWSYGGQEEVSLNPQNINIYNDTDSKIISLYLTVPNERLIDISGQVWLDGDTALNNKANGEENGTKEDHEEGMNNVLVYLYNSDGEVVRTAVTETIKDENGNEVAKGVYSFKSIDFDPNGYYVVFEYDGINYTNTTNHMKFIEFEKENFLEWYNDLGTNNFNKLYNEWYINPKTTLEQFIVNNYGRTTEGKYLLNEWENYINLKDEDNVWSKYINSEIKITGIISMAEEDKEEREAFNSKFITITGGEYSKDKEGSITTGTAISKVGSIKTNLTYTTERSATAGWTSILQTMAKHRRINGNDYSNVVQSDFAMDATSGKIVEISEINFGLVKRGIDLALRTDCKEARVTINDKEQVYPYSKNVIEVEGTETFDNVKYDLELFESDYNYRIRNYVSDNEMKYVENTGAEGQKTGDELKVYVTYELKLQNRSTSTGYIERVKYTHDPRYSYNAKLTKEANKEADFDYGIIENGNDMTISFGTIEIDDAFLPTDKDLKLAEGVTETLYLVFEANIHELDESFTNKAEIITYRTDDGLIDIDSAPGNYDAGIKEDDSDKAGALKITVVPNEQRTITGQVFDNDTKTPVNGVIVQLIELKPLANAQGSTQYYEYIWQETVSGYTGGKKMMVQPDSEGHWLEDSGLAKGEDGKFAFDGYIPGDYIIRYIYGEETYTYKVSQNEENQITLYDNIHNGQDYKSTIDKAYKELIYSKDNYTAGDSVARDNEARRLDTMGYVVNVDAEKGLLLKLLDNVTVDDLNEVEIKTLADIEPKTTIKDARTLKAEEKEQLNLKINTLKPAVLQNTWMCAETSRVVVEIDNDQKRSYENMNLGLEKRPETRISLQKTITSFKLTASNGQTIIDAYWDEDKNEIAGICDGLQAIPGTSWKYSVSPTELNTIIDGAKLEFAYDVILKNEGEAYLGSALADAYDNNSLTGYTDALINGRDDIISDVQANGRNSMIGRYLSKAYYNPADEEGYSPKEARVQVTSIYDYINNDLDIVEGTELKQKEGAVDHYKLADNHSLQNIIIKRVLENKVPSDKLAKEEVVKYKVVLGRDPISSTGTLDFTNYIAEVMAYTNAAGRRAVATPGNAWAVDERNLKDDGKERIVEIDECSADKIQLGESYGEDKETIFIWLAIGVTAVAIIGAGAFATKKYIIK